MTEQNQALSINKTIKETILATQEFSFLFIPQGVHSVVYLSSENTRECLPILENYELIKSIFESRAITKISFGIKIQTKELQQIGIDVQEPCDISIAAHVLDSSIKDPNLTEIISTYLSGRAMPTSTASCCSAIAEVWQAQKVKIEEEGLLPVLLNIETPFIGVAAAMETVGLKIDRPALTRHIESLLPELQKLERAIYDKAGFEFNISSPQQLADVLYNKLKYNKVDRTSTKTDVLKRISPRTDLITLLLEYKDRAETISEGRGLIGIADADDIIRPEYTLSETGRTYTRAPNFQGIKRCLKKFIIPRPGHRLIEFDYSQIQFRLLAHFSGDPKLVKLFKEDADLHIMMASMIFNVPIDRVTPEQRKVAKVFNFGIIFGMGANSLSAEVHAETGIYHSPSVMDKFIKKFIIEYPEVRELKKRVLKDFCKAGHVRSVSGRKRTFKDSEYFTQVGRYTAAAKRAAFNFLLQGSEADIVKLSMIALTREFKQRGMGSAIIAMVHDSILFEVPESELEAASELIRTTMQTVVDLSVPLKVESKQQN